MDGRSAEFVRHIFWTGFVEAPILFSCRHSHTPHIRPRLLQGYLAWVRHPLSHSPTRLGFPASRPALPLLRLGFSTALAVPHCENRHCHLCKTGVDRQAENGPSRQTAARFPSEVAIIGHPCKSPAKYDLLLHQTNGTRVTLPSGDLEPSIHLPCQPACPAAGCPRLHRPSWTVQLCPQGSRFPPPLKSPKYLASRLQFTTFPTSSAKRRRSSC